MWHKPQRLNALADLLMLVGVLALLYGGAKWLLRVPALPVREVVFADKLVHTSREEIEQALPPALQGNFFSIDLDGVRAVLEAMPWVRKAEVRRAWPNRLAISIEEQQAVARWGEAELVNKYGEVFDATAPDSEAALLPVLFGPPGTAPEVLERFAGMRTAFEKLGEKAVQLTLSPRLAWQLKLANGLVVDLGREQPKSTVNYRLERFIEIYPERIARRAVKPVVVDLRYPNGFAMRVAGEGKGK